MATSAHLIKRMHADVFVTSQQIIRQVGGVTNYEKVKMECDRQTASRIHYQNKWSHVLFSKWVFIREHYQHCPNSKYNGK